MQANKLPQSAAMCLLQRRAAWRQGKRTHISPDIPEKFVAWRSLNLVVLKRPKAAAKALILILQLLISFDPQVQKKRFEENFSLNVKIEEKEKNEQQTP